MVPRPVSALDTFIVRRASTSSKQEPGNNMTQDQLIVAHVKEAEKRKLEVFNLGWGLGEDHIESKTDKGILATYVSGKGIVNHNFIPAE